MISNADDRRHTNFIITSEGYLSLSSTASYSLTNYNHDKATDTGDQTIDYRTKDLDFGFPSQTKKIFKVYVTYSSTDSTVPTMTYGKDTDTSPDTAFNSGNFATTSGIAIAEFTVNDTALTGIYSLSLKIAGATDHEFEIHDIAILFRMRPIK